MVGEIENIHVDVVGLGRNQSSLPGSLHKRFQRTGEYGV